MADDAERLRHDIAVLERLFAASRDRAEETGDPDGNESAFAEAYGPVLAARLERPRELEREWDLA